MVKTVTNPLLLNDGFGENYKMLIYTMMYAELNNLNFVFTPFKKFEHLDDEDSADMMKTLQNIINIDNLLDTEKKHENDKITLNPFQLLTFFHKNVEECAKSKTLQYVKIKFRENTVNTFDKGVVNICIHIRRMDATDRNRINNKENGILPGMDVPDELYMLMIQQFNEAFENQPKKCKFHVYSEGDEKDFEIYTKEAENVILHLNEPLDKTFTDLVYGDVLIIAPSALSYTAGMLSASKVIYYIRYCDKPLPKWNIVNNYESTRERYQYVVEIDGKLRAGFYDPIEETFDARMI